MIIAFTILPMEYCVGMIKNINLKIWNGSEWKGDIDLT